MSLVGALSGWACQKQIENDILSSDGNRSASIPVPVDERSFFMVKAIAGTGS